MKLTRAEQFTRFLSDLPEEERQTALTSAIGQVYLATEMVTQQARRLRASESVTYTEHQSDAVLFVFALHMLLTMLDLVHEIAPEAGRLRLNEAIANLRGVAGDTQDARDVLAHLDEYLAGFGKKQDKAGSKPLPWFSRTGAAYTVRVGAYALDVDATEAAALDAFAAAFPMDEGGV